MTRNARMRRIASALLLLGSAWTAGCSRPAPEAPIVRTWWIGRSFPEFDPGATPDPVRVALARLLSRSLVVFDTSGVAIPDAVTGWEVSPDGLRWTFRLKPDLAGAGGGRWSSEDFARTLRSALARTDHAAGRWAMRFVRGVDEIRPPREIRNLGVLTPDSATLVFELVRPDPRLAEKLAASGFGYAWGKGARGPSWTGASGPGAWRVAREDAGRLVLVRTRAARRGSISDTLFVRHGLGTGRARAVLRAGRADLAWPLPPGLAGEPLPRNYELGRARALPARHLVLVLRADVAPTTRLATRQALLHSIEWPELEHAQAPTGGLPRDWMGDPAVYEWPRFDSREVATWLERGDLGRSLHPRLAFDADGSGALSAIRMQEQASRNGLYFQLVPLRGAEWRKEALSGWQSQALLVESSPFIDGVEGEVARWVNSRRGPPPGEFRTGWRPQDIPAWDVPRSELPVAEWVRARLGDEGIATPVARLGWSWIQAISHPVSGHPRYGPDLPIWLELPAAPIRR